MKSSRLRGALPLMTLGMLAACAASSSGPGAGTAGQGGGDAGHASGSAGASGAAGASDPPGSAGVPGSAGASGSAGATGVAGATGSAGASGTAGAGGPGASGTAGASGAAGAVAGAAGTPGLTDPGTTGDGDFTLPSSHPADPLNNPMGAPAGPIITFQMKSTDSAIYPGVRGAYTRNVWVYVPKQYVPGTPAPFITIQDGGFAVWLGTNPPHTPDAGTATLLPGTANLPRILDNLINLKMLPRIVAIFVDNGGGDAEGSERGKEYDTVSGKYAEFVDQEVLPRVVSEVKTQLSIDLAFTKDPQGRATMGGSSGGAAAFSMLWWHPDLFARAIIFSGTFVRQESPETYPHGCWAYHDFDPYDATAPNGLVVKEPMIKPIRMWMEAAQNDSGAGGGPSSYRDFKLAAQRMAASFALKGYHYHFDYAMGAGHFDGGVIGQTLPSALLWLWRGYPVN